MKAQRQQIRVPGLNPPISHYTDAVRHGDFLFISGVGALDSEGRVVGKGDVVAQTRKVFENMRAVLEAAGMSFSDIVKVTVYLRDADDRERINPVREEYFKSARPASTLVEVSRLAFPDMLVEIEAVAIAQRAS